MQQVPGFLNVYIPGSLTEPGVAAMALLAAVLLSSGGVAPAWGGGFGAVRTPGFTQEGVTACLKCHFDKDMRAVASSPHGDSGNPHAPYSIHGCESCHGPGSFHVSRAHGGIGKPPLIDFGAGAHASGRERQLTACLNCHQDEQNASPQIRFSGSTHDLGNTICSSCHQLHTGQQSGEVVTQQAETCFGCHGQMRTDHPRMGRKIIDVLKRACTNCHDIHSVAKK